MPRAIVGLRDVKDDRAGSLKRIGQFGQILRRNNIEIRVEIGDRLFMPRECRRGLERLSTNDTDAHRWLCSHAPRSAPVGRISCRLIEWNIFDRFVIEPPKMHLTEVVK
jgi:hypothetical protein